MTDSTRHPQRVDDGDSGNITQTLKRLSLPAGGESEHDAEWAVPRTALLISRDSSASKWGIRWLSQVGLEPALCHDADEALALVRLTEPAVIIVDAGLRDRGGKHLLDALQADPDTTSPVIALCANAREVAVALEHDVTDVVRKPYEWRLVAHRAQNAVVARRREATLRHAQGSLAHALKVAEEARRQLRSRESFEPVTGLPNRGKFVELLRRTVAVAERDGNQVAVFVIGFNRFRLVVEAMGQKRADLVLADIGRSLEGCLTDLSAAQELSAGLRTAAAASIDHARFAMLLTCSGDDGELTALQQRVVERLSRPVQIAGQTVFLSTCVGVAVFPRDSRDVDSLLQRADNAMRDAQSRGGGFRFYGAATEAAAARKLKLENMLHEAIHLSELSLVYQPIIDLATRRTTGAEALLRWHQADGTTIPPGEFVPIAEEAGLMDRIGEYVLNAACRQLSRWQAAGIGIPRICVNLSRAQVMGRQLVPSVARALSAFGVAPENLELEISERGVLAGNADAVEQLKELKRLGVRLSLDDFGTGDSAIVYLREMPIDVIKIDQSYVQAVNDNTRDAAIVSAMIALGRQMGLTTVSEGVETEEQLATIQNLGCDECQGFFLSEPLAPADFPHFISRLATSR
jgi:diguanylate cyclase (GGDEF)-like protein